MEVDRIWRIDGLDGNANPSWQNSPRRRRKFVEELTESEEEDETVDEEAAEQGQSPEPEDRDSSLSQAADAPAEDGAPASSFRVIA